MDPDTVKWILIANTILSETVLRTFIKINNHDIFGLVVGSKFNIMNNICKNISSDANITTLPTYTNVLLLSANTYTNLKALMDKINERINFVKSNYETTNVFDLSLRWSIPNLAQPPKMESFSKQMYVLIDNSNLMYSARTSSEKPSNHNDLTMRVSIKNLTTLIENSNGPQEIKARIVAGSSVRNNNKVWESYKRYGYTCKIEDSNNISERNVDSSLHAIGLQFASDALISSIPGSRTLVLLTGDGNNHDSLTSFPKMVFSAAQMGMRVILWSWAHARSKIYTDIANHFTDGRVTLHDLDDYFDKIVYYEQDRYASQNRSRSRSRDRGRERDRDQYRCRGRGQFRERSRSRAPTPPRDHIPTPATSRTNSNTEEGEINETNHNKYKIIITNTQSIEIYPNL
jgi:hypothetical protein